MFDEPLIAEIASLLHEEPKRLTLAPGGIGGNNRTFTIAAGNRKFVAKCYFRDASDPRDRLKAEFEFLTYARRLGLTNVPRPVACSPARDLGIYEFVEGRKLTAHEVDAKMVDQAIEFFLEINGSRENGYALKLPPASEACFSMNEHFVMVDRRIARLAAMPAEEPVDRDAHEFAQTLTDRWENAKAGILKEARIMGDDLDAPVIERCISPSDFGFHNAILRPSGEICFIDFEYAGWDDPAKMVGDFFSHPAVGVSKAHYERFLAETMRYSRYAARLVARARLLFPVFQTKWCCIILNNFLPDSARRRRFADPSIDALEHKRSQLAKSKYLFNSMAIS